MVEEPELKLEPEPGAKLDAKPEPEPEPEAKPAAKPGAKPKLEAEPTVEIRAEKPEPEPEPEPERDAVPETRAEPIHASPTKKVVALSSAFAPAPALAPVPVAEYEPLPPRAPWAPDARARIASWQVCKHVLGEGTFGVVRECVATVGGVRHVCAQKEYKFSDDDEGLPHDVLRELTALCSLPPHPCVLRADAVVVHKNRLFTLTPRYNGNLACYAQAVTREHGAVPETVLCAAAVQLLHGLRHMHAHGFLHRDIKMENVLVSSDGDVVLADLGLCRNVAVLGDRGAAADGGERWDMTLPQTTEVCTLWTRAPEVNLAHTIGSARCKYSYASDVWSLGATLLAVAHGGEYAITGSGASDFLVNVWRVVGRPSATAWPLLRAAVDNGHAFAALPDATFPHYRRRGVVFAKLRAAAERADLSDAACDFLACLLDVDPANRATISRAMAHPFISGMTAAAAAFTLRNALAMKPPALPDPATLHTAIILPEADTVWVSGWLKFMSSPAPTFLAFQTDVNERMRAILLDWLWEVSVKFYLHAHTYFDMVTIVDRFLSVQFLIRQKLQLLGVAALLLMSKVHEVYSPELCDFVYITDKAYTREQIRAMEHAITRVLGGCFLLPPTERPYSYLMAYVWGAAPTLAFYVAVPTEAGAPRVVVAALAAICTHAATLLWCVSKPAAAARAAIYIGYQLAPEEVVSWRTLLPIVQAVGDARSTPSAAHAPLDVDAAACVAALVAFIKSGTALTACWKVGGIKPAYNTRPTFAVLFKESTRAP